MARQEAEAAKLATTTADPLHALVGVILVLLVLMSVVRSGSCEPPLLSRLLLCSRLPFFFPCCFKQLSYPGQLASFPLLVFGGSRKDLAFLLSLIATCALAGLLFVIPFSHMVEPRIDSQKIRIVVVGRPQKPKIHEKDNYNGVQHNYK